MTSTLLAALPAAAAPGEDDTPIGNPDLDKACGLDIAVILDESGSIDSSNATDDVRDAFLAFTDALKNTGSRMAVVEFSTVARLPIDYTTITTETKATIFDPYITNDYNPDGRTNWEDATRAVRYFAPRPSAEKPHLVVFITDGDPNTVVDHRDVPQPDYSTLIPLATNQTSNVNQNPASDRAVSNSNAIKAGQSHILAVAVGQALNNQGSLNRIIDQSGPDIYDGTGDFDIATDDVFRVPEFDQLEAALREAAFDLCSPSITVDKLVDLTPDPGTDDAVPGVGVEVTADIDAPGGIAEWILPDGATGTTATDVTDGSGFVTFQWQNGQAGTARATITEEDPAPGFEFVPDRSTCTYRTPDLDADLPVPNFIRTPLGYEFDVPDEAIVTCILFNQALPEPGIDIEKSTNGLDADDPPAQVPPVPGAVPEVPVVAPGDPVTWEYQITNTGNVTLTDLAVTDDQEGTVPGCPTTLGPGETATCSLTGTAIDTGTGFYANEGAVTATDPFGTVVADTDPSHYIGLGGGIEITKFVITPGGRFDANAQPGPLVPVGATVSWEYEVVNTGASVLENLVVADSEGVTIDCGAVTVLQPNGSAGDRVTCTGAASTATAGQYDNLGAAIATVQGTGETVLAADPAHHFGADPGIDVEKATNTVDADDPADAPVIQVGRPVGWTYVITNTGNVPIDGFTLTDDQGVVIACPLIFGLPPGASTTCAAGGTAEYTGDLPGGVYRNVADVSATVVVQTNASGPDGTETVTDDDPSHYLGLEARVDIEKATNGEDADAPTGPLIPVGGPVTWTYEVTNTGNVTLGIAVGDVVLNEVVDCAANVLAPGESTTCTETGVAAPGQYVNVGLVLGVGTNLELVGDIDPSHYLGVGGGINLEKSTNGVDADTPDDAPFVEVGGEVVWDYLIRNESTAAISDIALTDDVLGPIDCPQTTLDAGASMVCEATGTAEQVGLYANVGTVTAIDAVGAPLTDTDPSHYRGYEVGIDIEKSTNGEDADTPTGPFVPVGDPVTWEYVVTSNGLPVRDVVVTDDQGVTPVLVSGDTDGDGILDPDETWVYRATGTAVAGQYANVGTVTGFEEILEEPVTDTDPSHYLGVGGAIDLEKATNGVDADTPDEAPFIALGDPVSWTYVVTNESSGPISGIEVTDDVLGPINCPRTTLDAGERMTCEAAGTADVEGLYANVGAVTAIDATGATLTDVDPSHYQGAVAAIDIEKSTNGVDSDLSPGEEIQVGSVVTWEYVVTSAGLPLTDITVTDDRGVTPVFVSGDTDGDGILDPDETWVYRATGTAIAGAYSNIGTVVGTPIGSGAVPLTDSDPSHYVGVEVGGITPPPELPVSGMDAVPWLLGALALLGAGLVLLRAARRFGT